MILEQFSLQGKTAIVTGCRTGIGQGMAVALAQAGADIVGVGDRGFDDTPRLVQEAGRRFVGLQADLKDPANARKVVEEAVAACGEIHILVNNAGITRDGLAMRMKDDQWQEVIDTNLTPAFRLSRIVMRGMMKARCGRIINIVSVVGSMGNAGQANYAAAKAGVAGLTRALARELASRNITVNAVAPGFIETDMTRALPEDHRQALLAQIPLARLGQPDDIANAVVFLASPAAAYVTGVTLHVNGGMYMV